MQEDIVITGIGMVTPLGHNPVEVLRRIEAGESAAAPPANFDASPFACPVCAAVKDFDAQQFVSESKMIRLMNRDAQLAVAAARLALQDAGVKTGGNYAPEEIALFGATGLAGLPLSEVIPLIKASSGPDGSFDLDRFGDAGLRAVSPILSFKILSNMPLCFVSICENIQGANGIYTPWEGQGAQAVEAATRAIRCGDARCALAGGCDVKTHELAFLSLQQQGLFNSWQENRAGVVPGEGAAFLVLEEEKNAAARGARIYARIAQCSLQTRKNGWTRGETCMAALKKLNASQKRFGAIVGAGNGDEPGNRDQCDPLSALQIFAGKVIHPKRFLGDLFAAAGLVQIGLGAVLARQSGGSVLANCFSHGSEQAAFVLEKA